ncbi:glycosyltransferase family 2 protein [Leifsonia flava]|uniref:glycosyltransferase family 2 protein n=1 Tax=Orlajensenia leifsoniae TaxID=2561933 RepID=UPI00142F7AAF|nr:glycosyltransferase family A protein [Leifsonia flava]
MTSPSVDVVIAVHSPDRPVERAVGSVLLHTTASVRVTVVVHNTDAAPVVARLSGFVGKAGLRILELHDGIASPAGPFNLGLDHATAPFTSVLGSDDEFEPGAIDAWLAVANSDSADVVIACLRHAGGSPVPTPPTRPFRQSSLDPVKDRLSYRSAPLGLVSRAAFGELRFAEGLPSGEDLPYVSRLWFSGRRISSARSAPAYRLHDDSGDRVTFATRSIAEEFAYLPSTIGSSWFRALPAPSQSALVAKFLRIHLFGAVSNRPDPALWATPDREELAEIARLLLSSGHGIEEVLSRADRDLLDAILDPSSCARTLGSLAIRRRRRLAVASLFPRRLTRLLHAEAPLRFSAASALANIALPRRAYPDALEFR